jgi:hypothetical protein
MIISICPSGGWHVNLPLPYLDANYVTPLNPFTCFVFSDYSVDVMNIDQQLEI